DHGEPGRQRRAPLLFDRGDGDVQGRLQGHVVQLRQGGADLLHVEPAIQAGDRGAEQLPAAQRAYGRHGVFGGGGVPAHRRRGLGGERFDRPRGQFGFGAEHGDGFGGVQQQAGDVPAGAEQAGHAFGGGGLIAQQAQVPGGGAEFVADLPEAEQAGVGVG